MKNIGIFVLSFSLLSLSGAIVFFALEVREMRVLIPEIVEHIDEVPLTLKKTNEEINKGVPVFEEFVSLIPGIMKEVRRTRNEVKATRNQIPLYFDRAEDIIGKAKEVGEESGSGVFLGFVKGVLSSPFELIGSIFSSDDHKLTRGDSRLLKRAVEEILSTGKVGSVEKWNNSETSNRGSVKVIDIDLKRKCRTLKVIINRNNDTKTNKSVEVCQNSESMWELR